jgi:phenylpropionate dioxygenase-like ring-hydroxylating dioxygenase large terminal subunit
MARITDGVTPTSAVDVDTGVTGYGLAPPTLVPKVRYVSAEFAALENERLWPRVWQLACTVDHVPAPGDYFEYRIGPYSVLIVRDDDGTLRAFQNVCRHRGNALCQGSGGGLTELRCPFHRWAWDLCGELREVPSRKAFGILRNEDFPLVPVQVDPWGPMVFVNLDLDAPPIMDFLEGVPDDAAWADVDEFRCQVTATTSVDCNWKVVVDGFSETYHVQGIHAELLGSIDDVNAPQRLWERHGVSYQDYGVPSPRLGRDVPDEVVWESFVQTQGDRMGPDYRRAQPMPPIPSGVSVRDVIAERIRANQSRFGIDLSRFGNGQILRLSQYNLFPNITVLLWGEMLNLLVARPGPSPDKAELTSYLLHRAPSPDTPRSKPRDLTMPVESDFGFVLNQDIEILQTAQRGLRQPGLTHLVVSGEESRIINMQRNLERYLGIVPSELVPLASAP